MLSSIYSRSIFLVVLAILKPSRSLVYPSIQWTPRNPMFQEPEITRVKNVQSMSRINIVCPNTATNVDIVKVNTPKEWLYENLWIVSKNSYDNCNASSKTDRLLLRCDTPLKLKYYTIYFLRYSATIQGLEFPVGREYYFIATSDGTEASLDNRFGGNCARGSMKMKFYVCKGPTDPRCLPQTPTNPPQTYQATNQQTDPLTSPFKRTNPKYTTIEENNSIQTIAVSSTTQRHTTTSTTISTDKDGVQSDEPSTKGRMTLQPTITSQSSTLYLPETTKPVKSDIELLLRRDTCKPCAHDNGPEPSWNVVIPLLVVIFILVVMNSIVICRLKQNNKSCLPEDNLTTVSARSEKQYNFKNNNQKTPGSPVLV